MSDYICTLPTESYFDFKTEYYKRFPNSTYRFGQSFINRFIKREDNSFDFNALWEEKDVAKAEAMIYDFITQVSWDIMSLQPVRNSY